jgi:hypothetical protein
MGDFMRPEGEGEAVSEVAARSVVVFRPGLGRAPGTGHGPDPLAGAGAGPAPGAVTTLLPVPDVLAYLAGTWHVERTARDLASGLEGRFRGTTVFGPLGGGEADGDRDQDGAAGRGTPSPGSADPGDGAGGGPAGGQGLLHHESGTFVWQGTPRPAERILRYLPGDRTGTARVEFSDGRPFHDLDLSSGTYVADHPCAADLYRGEFTVLGHGRWRTRWRVRGPAKDILLITDYVRRTWT